MTPLLLYTHGSYTNQGWPSTGRAEEDPGERGPNERVPASELTEPSETTSKDARASLATQDGRPKRVLAVSRDLPGMSIGIGETEGVGELEGERDQHNRDIGPMKADEGGQEEERP